MIKSRKSKFIVIILLIILVFLILRSKEANKEVRLGYFHGGRTMLLYRAYIKDEFVKAGVALNLVTKNLYQDNYYTIPKSYEEIKKKKFFGKVRGTELIDEVVKGDFDGATPGESSFIEAISEGAPIVAVAMLGYDTKDMPGHAILFRKDVVINNPQDIKGKTLISRRAGSGDLVFLKEFLTEQGLDPEKDVKILDQVMDDDWIEGLKNGKADGGYYHLMVVEILVKTNQAYVYRKFDWVNPEMSHALLVFHKDFIKKHPKEVEKIIRAYMKEIKYEHNLSKEERLKDPGEGFLYGLQMEKDFQGMNLPQYKFPPLVREDLLNDMQDLLIKHNKLDKKMNLRNFIDNSFVQKVYEELK